MTEAERDICKIYLEDLADLNKSHSCNEYKMLMGMLNAEPCKDTISRQAAIDAFDVGAELLRRVLDEVDIVGTEREKYKWGLELIESCISDIKALPSAQPE